MCHCEKLHGRRLAKVNITLSLCLFCARPRRLKSNASKSPIRFVLLLYVIKAGSQAEVPDKDKAERRGHNVTVAPSHSMHRLIPSVPDDVYMANVTDHVRNNSTESRSVNDDDGFKPFRPSAFLGTSEPVYMHNRRDVVRKNRIQFNDKQDSVHSPQTESFYQQDFPFDYKHYLKPQVNQDHAPAVVEPTPDGPEASTQHNTGPFWPKTSYDAASTLLKNKKPIKFEDSFQLFDHFENNPLLHGKMPPASATAVELLKNKKPLKFEANFDGNEHFDNGALLEGKIPATALELLKNKKPLKFEDSFQLFDHFENNPVLHGKMPPASATAVGLLKNKKPLKFEEHLNDYDQFENSHLLQSDDFKYPYFIPAGIRPTTEATKPKPDVKVYDHKHAIKGLLQLAAALIPIGLFVAALQPTVIQVNSTQPTEKTPGKFRSLEAADISLLNSLRELGLGTTGDPECERKSFCQFIVSGSTAEPDSAQHALWHLVTRSPSEVPSSVYLDDLVSAVRAGQCDTFKCDHASTNSTASPTA